MKTGRGHKKATDAEIREAYLSSGSLVKAAEVLGMCAQSVHERCVRMGINKKVNLFTDADMDKVKKVYKEGFLYGDGKLNNLAKHLGRTKHFICRKAKSAGLTNEKRKSCDKAKSKSSKISKEWHKENEHPKGMLGKVHTQKTKDLLAKRSGDTYNNLTEEEKRERIFKIMKTRHKNGTFSNNRQKTTWKSGWRVIGGKRKYYRSRWEANYARYLQSLKDADDIKSWEHEPKVFWFSQTKKGGVGYLPDFRVILKNGSVEYHEVKGWMDERSKSKIEGMQKFYPDTSLILIQQKEYNQIKSNLSKSIRGWEQQ